MKSLHEKIAQKIIITDDDHHLWQPKQLLMAFNGTTVHPVRALLNLNSNYRLLRRCSHPRCINPAHFVIRAKDIKQRVLQQVTITEDGHHLWTGALTTNKPRWHQRPGLSMMHEIPPSPILQHDGKRMHPVRALLNLQDGYRLRRLPSCNYPLCVNPDHFRAFPSKTIRRYRRINE